MNEETGVALHIVLTEKSARFSRFKRIVVSGGTGAFPLMNWLTLAPKV